MNEFLTDNVDFAKQELLLTAVQDYREDLVKVTADINGYQEAELFGDRSYLLDSGIPSTFTIKQATMYAIVNASMQYKFWTNDATGYKRYAKDGKSGAILLSNLFAEKLAPLFDVDGDDIPDINSLYHKPDQSKPIDELVKALNDFPSSWRSPGFGWINRAQSVTNLLKNKKMASQLAKAITTKNCVTVHMAKVLANKEPELFADPYLKKAQLALFMLASWINLNKKTEVPIDIHNLTLFADYQVPRVMQQIGLLKYNHHVFNSIGMYIEFPQDSVAEKALRAATILAGDQIASKYSLPAAVIDNWLWTKRNDCTHPHHLTDTSRY